MSLSQSDIFFKDEADFLMSLSEVRNVVEDFDATQADFCGDFKGDNATVLLRNLMENMPTLPAGSTPNICNEEYGGPFNFEVSLIPNNAKNPWVYSPDLNKIFIDMDNPFPVDFKINGHPPEQLFIRAMPIFSLPQHSHELVSRCINHDQSSERTNIGISENVRAHIIRCQNGNTVYLGNKNNKERLSLILPLSDPPTGSDSVREMFTFVCKSSCPSPSGMNRRPIEVIFTLENAHGMVLGRKTMKVRICSCPKRDKEKEEKELTKDESCPPIPRGKKRKLNDRTATMPSYPSNVVLDTKKYSLNIDIVGKHNILPILKYCHDLMAGDMLRTNDTQARQEFQKCLTEMAQKMGNLNL